MTSPKPEAMQASRERLLASAHAQFYEAGVGVGVQAICTGAQVSKRSMYQLFASKDDLLAASLAQAAPSYLDPLMPDANPGETPRERILRVFEYLEGSSCVADFRGCPFVATAIELKSADHPASQVARQSEDVLTAFFRAEAKRAGAADPGSLAEQLTIVFDGASSHAVVQARPLNGVAIATATAVLASAGL